MRVQRIVISPTESAAAYHCISRTVNGQRLSDAEREVLRRQMWQLAEFCGVEIITYAFMADHLHVLVRVPAAVTVSDAELLRRYHVSHPKLAQSQAGKDVALRKKIAGGSNDAEVKRWREQQLILTGNLSQFMKLFKQRFTGWYNREHQRFGPIWSERFKSVLVADGPALRMMAAFIDLYPVREKLVKDPKDYRFGGYGEAVAGNKKLRASLAAAFGATDWKVAQNHYRQLLFGDGRKKGGAEPGSLSAAELLRSETRSFTSGAVLGDQEFVNEQLRRYRKATGTRKKTPPLTLPSVSDGGELVALRGGRQLYGAAKKS